MAASISTNGSARFTIPTDEYRALPIPGYAEGKSGTCFVKATDLPPKIDDWMKVNPRVPKRTAEGVVSGPVIKGIRTTLRDKPARMVVMNQGVFLMVDAGEFTKGPGGKGELVLTLTDPERHGLVNGGHTYAAIRAELEEIESMGDGDEAKARRKALEHAYVKVHIFQGIDPALVPDIAEGLNTSKQVDDASLANLAKRFVPIQEAMKGKPGADEIGYTQNANKELYVTEVVTILELFNGERFCDTKHPSSLYRYSKKALDWFLDDADAMNLLVPKAPELLRLADEIKFRVPAACDANGYEYGRSKVGKKRAGSDAHRDTPLPFAGKKMDYSVPNGWLFPLLAAFRANLRWNLEGGVCEWRVDPFQLLPQVINAIVGVCVQARKGEGLEPDELGMKDHIYSQCYDKVQLQLAKMNKLA
ncbi:MAG: AIPR family protein [Phycisphaerales bacterium]|nr:AIPR family protein [Phycisphaerales bacterium]MCI0631395.1 AIPR family protein [Phycisphaerales bacterium]